MSRGSIRLRRKEVYNKTQGKCLYCMEKLSLSSMHIDHLYPFSKGGNNDLMNLVPSCRSCNLQKSNKLVVDQVITRTVEKIVKVDNIVYKNDPVDTAMIRHYKHMYDMQMKVNDTILSLLDRS